MKSSTFQTILRALAGTLLFLVAGCSRDAGSATASGDAGHGSHGRHEHHPPHGGTAVVLGHEEFHLELVRDSSTGTLSAYVLDAELDKFVRIAAPSLTIVASVGGEARPLALVAVASPATGETVGDTSLFETRAGWLKTVDKFDAEIPAITIRGTTFTAVKFTFPEGNDHP